jgi:hypothetical protein
VSLSPDWKEFIELLNEEGVEYVIVGGLALAAHGCPRSTGDLDVFVRISNDNASSLINVLNRFGVASLGLDTSDLKRTDQVIQLGYRPVRIDIMTAIEGVSFEDAWNSRVEMKWESLPVHVISKQHLILNKRSVGRSRDLADAEELENHDH